MAVVLTFRKYVPPPRFDGHPWVSARIDESDGSAGPWNQIDSITLSPVDTDPADPIERDFTTDNATIDAGWLSLIHI